MKLKYRANGSPFWRCPERAAPGGPYCRGRILSAVLEEAVWEKVCAIVRCPDTFLSGLRAKCEQARQLRERLGRRKANAEQELAKARLALDNLERERLRGDVDRALYERLRPCLLDDELRARVDLERAETDAIVNRPELPYRVYIGGEDGPLAIVAVGGDVKDTDLEQRRRRVRQFVERVVIDETGAYMIGVVPSASGRVSIHDIDHDKGPLPRCLKARFKMASTSWAASIISLRSLRAP
jgi:hypothetical protein